MQPIELHQDTFLSVLWDERSRIISIDWKEATAKMSDDDMKNELAPFAGYVENNRASAIIVEVTKFRHSMSPGLVNDYCYLQGQKQAVQK